MDATLATPVPTAGYTCFQVQSRCPPRCGGSSQATGRRYTGRSVDWTRGRYLPILCPMPRRTPGALFPLEVEILHAALSMQRSGAVLFHGFGLAQSMGEDAGGRLIGHGTLYKALGRLEAMGLLSSHWEQDPPDGRPRRRQYELTASGTKAALAPRGETQEAAIRPRLSPGTA